MFRNKLLLIIIVSLVFLSHFHHTRQVKMKHPRSALFYFCLKAGALSASILQSILNYIYLHQFMELQQILYDELAFGTLFRFITFLILALRGKWRCYYDKKRKIKRNNNISCRFGFRLCCCGRRWSFKSKSNSFGV